MELLTLFMVFFFVIGLGALGALNGLTHRRIAGPFNLHRSHIGSEGFYGGGFDI